MELPNIVFGIVILFLPLIQKVDKFLVVLGASFESGGTPKQLHEKWLELATYGCIVGSIFGVVQNVVDEI